MRQGLRIGMAQVAPVPGALSANAKLIADAYHAATAAGAQLVVTPELALTGYPPRDFLFRAGFWPRAEAEVAHLAGLTRQGPPLLLGTVARSAAPAQTGRGIQNVALLLEGGAVRAQFGKRLLPTYDVFDESRYFDSAAAQVPVDIAGIAVGITICEDLWIGPADRLEIPRYGADPAADLRAAGAELIINLSASPFRAGRSRDREGLVRRTAQRTGVPVVLVNLIGGHEELVFDGASVACAANGEVLSRGPAFESGVTLVDPFAAARIAPATWPDDLALQRQALVLGIRDYARHAGFDRALLGLSGGIDSALIASLAAEALGPDRVLGLGLPSEFSSPGSLSDAEACARALGIDWKVAPIEYAWHGLRDAARGIVGEGPFGLLEENIQSRARGAILMGIANESGRLLLTTGNKSELAVGYCTLYGDMCGGLAPIGDLWKTEVFELSAHEVQAGRIPRASLEKPPSAELRPDQRDEDSLPPYERLDRVLRALLEEERSPEQIAKAETDVSLEEARDVLRMVSRNEWKRRQAAPALRVSKKAFGTGRRIPLLHRDPDLESPETR